MSSILLSHDYFPDTRTNGATKNKTKQTKSNEVQNQIQPCLSGQKKNRNTHVPTGSLSKYPMVAAISEYTLVQVHSRLIFPLL